MLLRINCHEVTFHEFNEYITLSNIPLCSKKIVRTNCNAAINIEKIQNIRENELYRYIGNRQALSKRKNLRITPTNGIVMRSSVQRGMGVERAKRLDWYAQRIATRC